MSEEKNNNSERFENLLHSVPLSNTNSDESAEFNIFNIEIEKGSNINVGNLFEKKYVDECMDVVSNAYIPNMFRRLYW